MPLRRPLPLAPDAGHPGGPPRTWRQKTQERAQPLLAPTPFRLRPWRPRPAPPMPPLLRRALRQGHAWLLPRLWDGPYVLAATPGGPLLWRIESRFRRQAAVIPHLLPSLAPAPPAPSGPVSRRALRLALGPLLPSRTVARRRQALQNALSAIAGDDVVVLIPDRRTPRRSFARLRPEPAHGQIEIWDDFLNVRTLHGEIVPKVLLRLMLPLEERTPGPSFVETARATPGSAHAYLDALARLSAHFGIPLDHPFFKALRRP